MISMKIIVVVVVLLLLLLGYSNLLMHKLSAINTFFFDSDIKEICKGLSSI